MNDQAPSPERAEAPAGRAPRRLLFALPDVAFLAVALALALGLQRDPSLVPSPLVGRAAPSTSLEPVPGFGPGFTAEDFAGGVTLVNVFASWCVSCRDEHALLVRLAERENATIFGLAYKDAPEDAAAWLTEYGNPYSATALDLNGRGAIEWGVYGVPETFLIGPDGVVAWKKIGPLAAEDLENELLPRMAALRLAAQAMAAAQETDAGQSAATSTEVAAPASLPNLAWLSDPRALPDTPFLVEGGREAHFADYAGKAIVLNVWATWCPPCLQEMPSLDRLAAAHGSEDLVVMTLSVDRGDAAPILAFYERIGAENLGLYHDPTMAVSRALRVFGLPTTLLVDHEGQIVAQLVGTAEWDSPAALDAILPLAQAARAARLGTAQQAQAGD